MNSIIVVLFTVSLRKYLAFIYIYGVCVCVCVLCIHYCLSVVYPYLVDDLNW